MPRFVILEHDWPARHWDLLLEAGEVLRAWRLLEEPGAARVVLAESNFDHRLMYLDYEGPLTGDRGCVTRWDAGEFEWSEEPGNTSPPALRGRGRRASASSTGTSGEGEKLGATPETPPHPESKPLGAVSTPTSPPQSRGRGEEERFVIHLNGAKLKGRFEIENGQFRRVSGD